MIKIIKRQQSTTAKYMHEFSKKIERLCSNGVTGVKADNRYDEKHMKTFFYHGQIRSDMIVTAITFDVICVRVKKFVGRALPEKVAHRTNAGFLTAFVREQTFDSKKTLMYRR